jgi:hypothetical protein
MIVEPWTCSISIKPLERRDNKPGLKIELSCETSGGQAEIGLRGVTTVQDGEEFHKANKSMTHRPIPFVGLKGSPLRWKGCLGE